MKLFLSLLCRKGWSQNLLSFLSKHLFYSRVSVASSKARSDIIDGDIIDGGRFVGLEPDFCTTAVSCLVYLHLLVPMIAVTGDVTFLDRLNSLDSL